jgi:hypothetical protein
MVGPAKLGHFCSLEWIEQKKTNPKNFSLFCIFLTTVVYNPSFSEYILIKKTLD